MTTAVDSAVGSTVFLLRTTHTLSPLPYPRKASAAGGNSDCHTLCWWSVVSAILLTVNLSESVRVTRACIYSQQCHLQECMLQVHSYKKMYTDILAQVQSIRTRVLGKALLVRAKYLKQPKFVLM